MKDGKPDGKLLDFNKGLDLESVDGVELGIKKIVYPNSIHDFEIMKPTELGLRTEQVLDQQTVYSSTSHALS